MPERNPINTTNLDRYGSDTLPWSRAHGPLTTGAPGHGATYVLGTTGPDCRPHATVVGAVWYDGDLYFTSNPDTRKSRNLAKTPASTLTVQLKGIDLVFEGDARRTTDPNQLEAVVAIYHAGGWPAEVEGDAIAAPYSAPSAGPPPWHLYRFVFDTIFGVTTEEPYGATRWQFRD